MSPGLRALTVGTALGCGAMAGAFFAFSSFVMAGLARLRPEQGIAAMQSINITAVRPAFMAGLFGTAAASVAVAVIAVRSWGDRPAVLLLAGSTLYLVGTIGITVVRNVPLNDALAALDPDSRGAPAAWTGYVEQWTRWNHVRTATALAAAAALIVANQQG